MGIRVALVMLSILAAACGRSGLDDYLAAGDDASSDGNGIPDGSGSDVSTFDSGSDAPTFFGDSSSFEDSPSPGRDGAAEGSTACGDCAGCCQGTVCLGGESTDACGIYGLMRQRQQRHGLCSPVRRRRDLPAHV